MTLRIAAAFAVFAIALIFAACGGDGGIDVVSDDERQERDGTLDRELDGDAGLGGENSSDAQDDTLDRELDGDADDSSAGGRAAAERSGVLRALSDLPCSRDEGFVRLSDGHVGCVPAVEIEGMVSCGENSRAVVDFVDLPDDPGAVPLTACVPIDDTPDSVFEGLAASDR